MEVIVKGKWHLASVTGIRPRKRLKIKFDKHKEDKYDKMYVSRCINDFLKVFAQFILYRTIYRENLGLEVVRMFWTKR